MTRQLLVVFTVSEQRFAVGVNYIAEILPLIDVIKVPGSKHYISGVCNYRGKRIPVIDTCQLLFEKSSKRKTCTRIIIIEHKNKGSITTVGFMAEKVFSTESYDLANASNHQLAKNDKAYMETILPDKQGDIQLINLEMLIPEETRSLKETINIV